MKPITGQGPRLERRGGGEAIRSGRYTLERSSRETGVAGLYGRANLTLWLVGKGGGREEGEAWKCWSEE